jgi:MFS family permease
VGARDRRAAAPRRVEPVGARTLLLAAYLLFAWFAREAFTWETRRRSLVRGWTAALATAFAALAVVRLGTMSNGVPLGYALAAAVAAGGAMYASASSSDRAEALAVRRLGWLLMAAALAVPSTATLFLPLLAPLALTLGGPARSRDRLGAVPSTGGPPGMRRSDDRY